MISVVNQDDAFSIETMESGSELEGFVTTHDHPNIRCAVSWAEVDLDLAVGQQLDDDCADGPNGLFPIKQLELHTITRLRSQ